MDGVPQVGPYPPRVVNAAARSLVRSSQRAAFSGLVPSFASYVLEPPLHNASRSLVSQASFRRQEQAGARRQRRLSYGGEGGWGFWPNSLPQE